MSDSSAREDLSKHVFQGQFLNGRFRIEAYFDCGDRVFFSEWKTDNPREVSMTPNTRKRFEQEYNLFMQNMVDDCAKLVGEPVAVLLLTKEKEGVYYESKP